MRHVMLATNRLLRTLYHAFKFGKRSEGGRLCSVAGAAVWPHYAEIESRVVSPSLRHPAICRQAPRVIYALGIKAIKQVENRGPRIGSHHKGVQLPELFLLLVKRVAGPLGVTE